MIGDEEVDDFLEHHGVLGMKWGVRRAARQQRVIDQIRRTAEGKGSIRDKTATSLLTPIRGGAQKSAQRQLDKNLKLQKNVLAGKSKAQDMLLRFGGVNIRNLNYTYTPPK